MVQFGKILAGGALITIGFITPIPVIDDIIGLTIGIPLIIDGLFGASVSIPR